MHEQSEESGSTIDVTGLTIRPPRLRVDRRFVLWRTLQALFWAVGVLGGLGTLYGLVAGSRPWVGPVLVVAGVVYLVNLTVMPTARYRVHRWETTDDAVYALQGWITRKWQIVPVSRIQSIDVEAGPLQQLLGIATITVVTASGDGSITIEGLTAEVAHDAVRRLKDVTAATPGDAT